MATAAAKGNVVRVNRRTIEAMAEAVAARKEDQRRAREERGRLASQPKEERQKGARAEERNKPPIEQMGGAEFALEPITDKRAGGGSVTIGKAYRRKPMIDTLFAQGLFTEAEHKALWFYRHHADIADRSPVSDSLGKQVYGRGAGGGGPTVELINALEVVRNCEAAAGSLRDILRAVVVNDTSLSQWAMDKGGAVEECKIVRDYYGRVIRRENCRWKAKPKILEVVKLEIIMAAKRVEAELSA